LIGQYVQMKRNSFLAATAITVGVLIISFFGYAPQLSASSADSAENAEWQLTVTGAVGHPLNLSWTEIVAMPKSTVNAALVCVDMPNYILAQGDWAGIKLRTLLEEAGISAGAIKVGFYAQDGYSTDLTVETAMRDDVILAYEKDGKPLDETLRLVVPGKWGYKWIAQVVGIELFNYNFLGVWESRGYSDEAETAIGSGQALSSPPSAEATPSPAPSPTQTPEPTQPSSPAPSQSPSPTPTPLPSSQAALMEMDLSAAAIAFIVLVVAAAIVLRIRGKRPQEPRYALP
jgi:DMSO/TMAO reductase YedYZ molybdopterin-dependent catalytic subunit